MAKKTKNIESVEADAPKLYTTLEKEASAEFTEKKSVFIGYACPVKTENEAVEFIKKIKAPISICLPRSTHSVPFFIFFQKTCTLSVISGVYIYVCFFE